VLADVTLGVAAAGPEREQLHQLARVVLVRLPLRVVAARQEEEHRRIAGDPEQEVLERAERLAAEESVLAEHEPLGRGVLDGREPVVPDERHALHERPVGADHPVEPPEMVVAPLLGRPERLAVDPRARTAQALRRRPDQRQDRASQALARQGVGLPWARAEARTPEQALGLGAAEATAVYGDCRHALHARWLPGDDRQAWRAA
jgi:hypothetical protein